MKIDRLIGILSILLQQDKVTAPFLAEKFEVSRRTINRDIEDLCRAGIPIATRQGQNGGITIMEGYKVDRALLTSSDMQAILAGLRSLDSISGTSRYRQLMEKFSLGSSAALISNEHIVIDLASWYKSTLAPKIELIQECIDRKETLGFHYYGPGGEGKRILEPYLLIFQWSSWYVYGYCRLRSAFRLFKLNRMQSLAKGGETYEEREYPPYQASPEKIYPRQIEAAAVLDASMKWRLIEEYGMESFTEQEDGTLYLEAGFSDKQSLFSWMLSFGEKGELRKPEKLREEFYGLVQKVAKKYRKPVK